MNDRPDTAADGGIDEAAAHWAARLLSDEAGEAEMMAFRAWIAADPAHRTAFERARAIWHAMPRPAPVTVRRRVPLRAAMAAAAALVLFVVTSPGLLFPPDLASATGEVRSVSLPDGTRLWLDSESAVDLAFTDDAREVRMLRGRAYFDVASGERPFRVIAAESRIADIGTAFSVDVTGIAAELDVAVDEGLVAVERDGISHELGAGKRVMFDRVSSTLQAGGEGHSDWRQGRIVLDRVPLDQALQEIDRYRPGRIVTVGLTNAGRRVSGTLFAHRLDEGLDTLARDQRLVVTRLPWLVIVRDAKK